MKSLSKNARTSLELLLEKLQQKIRINFSNPSEAFRFFDISLKEKISKQQFAFSCAFLDIDCEFKDVLELFDVLDDSGDGFIDEAEFEMVFRGVDSWNSHNYDIMNSILRDSRLLKYGIKPSGNIDLELAQNTSEKIPYNAHDIHTYPHFFGKKASRVAESRNQDFANTQVVNPPSNRKRTLSIMDKHGKVMSPLRGIRRSTAHKAE